MVEHIQDPMHSECVALFQGVKLVKQLGMGHVIFETDCLNQQHAITSNAPLGVLFRDARGVHGSHAILMTNILFIVLPLVTGDIAESYWNSRSSCKKMRFMSLVVYPHDEI